MAAKLQAKYSKKGPGAIGAAVVGKGPEPLLRDDPGIIAIIDRVNPNIVPLDDRYYAPIWAFRLTDALAAVVNPATPHPLQGTARLFAKTSADSESELATFQSMSGLLTVRTRTMNTKLPKDPDMKWFVMPHLVSRAGGTIAPDRIKQISIRHDGYETETFDADTLPMPKSEIEVWPSIQDWPSIVISVAMVPTVNNPVTGVAAFLFGRVPAKFKTEGKLGAKPGVQVTITAPAMDGAGTTAGVENDYRFVLYGKALELLPGAAPNPQQLTIRFKTDPPTNSELELTYAITRDESDAVGLLGANNTARTKLIGIQQLPADALSVKDIPPIHFLLI
ncbi:hypothetical protein X770_00935 [Mesorhizobium sp. LSJC269B00]|uniref:hypothetical protein n=1 Tax=Mesorhizobium sp. LSJC269B00 TaxID=1287326 RepID=UPI0003CE82DA|nr:hypothetical protein [Mesorhizobium sp. LSJC269B00]ESW93817.1 hypothetical protein X770_00935 [Mesorhizobium sp. LSJC269B00]